MWGNVMSREGEGNVNKGSGRIEIINLQCLNPLYLFKCEFRGVHIKLYCKSASRVFYSRSAALMDLYPAIQDVVCFEII